MGLPGHRRTSSHKRRRAAHFALKPSALTVCSHCKQPILPHYACKNCGYYRGRVAMKVKSKLTRKMASRASKVEKKEEKE